MDASIEATKRALQQLQEQHAAGTLSQDQYDAGRAPLERQLLALVMQDGAAAAAAAAPAAASSSPAPVEARPSPRLWALVGACTVLLAVGGYLWKGSPEALRGAPQSAEAQAPDMQQIESMVEKLALRMQEQPDDAQGWTMLGRSYIVLGRIDQALAAYARAVALRPDDASLLADYADALAVRNQGQLAGQPMQLVERALKLEPDNLKALAMAGSHAFDQADYAGAVRHWERLLRLAPPDNPVAQQMQAALDEARRRAAAGSTGGAAAGGAAAARSQAPAAAASVSGTVSLAPALRAQAQPDDTVFIFARAAEGARMPLAILRKQVRDLPLQFTLDDSLAMSGAAPLSSAKQVIVSARVSRSGNAMPQPGDLSGQTGVVPLGTQGLQLQISEQVKP